MFKQHPHFIDLSVPTHFTMGGGSNAPAFRPQPIPGCRRYGHDSRPPPLSSSAARRSPCRWMRSTSRSANGEWTFNGSLTNDALADFLLGRPSPGRWGIPSRPAFARNTGGRMSRTTCGCQRLNVHVGVRWEPSLPEHDILARGSHFSHARVPGGSEVQRVPERAGRSAVSRRPGHLPTPTPTATSWASRRALAWRGIRREGHAESCALPTAFSLIRRSPLRPGTLAACAPWGSTIA